MIVRRHLTRGLALVLGLLMAVNYVPELLAFPYKAEVRGVTIRAMQPIGPAIEGELARADLLDAQSPIGGVRSTRLFLTDGGWRWTLLALQAHGAFALTRPLSGAVVINRSDIASDSVWNGAAVAGHRTLSGVIAHETVHLMLVHRYGLRVLGFPHWKVEGYADHVAQESSLSDSEAARLKATGQSVPALAYYDGRKRVKAALASGQSVDQLFRGK